MLFLLWKYSFNQNTSIIQKKYYVTFMFQFKFKRKKQNPDFSLKQNIFWSKMHFSIEKTFMWRVSAHGVRGCGVGQLTRTRIKKFGRWDGYQAGKWLSRALSDSPTSARRPTFATKIPLCCSPKVNKRQTWAFPEIRNFPHRHGLQRIGKNGEAHIQKLEMNSRKIKKIWI